MQSVGKARMLKTPNPLASHKTGIRTGNKLFFGRKRPSSAKQNRLPSSKHSKTKKRLTNNNESKSKSKQPRVSKIKRTKSPEEARALSVECLCSDLLGGAQIRGSSVLLPYSEIRLGWSFHRRSLIRTALALSNAAGLSIRLSSKSIAASTPANSTPKRPNLRTSEQTTKNEGDPSSGLKPSELD